MSLASRLGGPGPSGFGYGSTAEQVTEGLSLVGKQILVTGCNSGLGFETVRVLCLRGARVIATARSLQKARTVESAIDGDIWPLACELAEPGSILECVRTLRMDGVRLDAIVCNAGIMALPRLVQAHGYELQFFTNHMGHFILVTRLLDRLAQDGRVVVVSSNAHRAAPREGIEFDNLSGERGYGPRRAYGQSKLANLLFAKELAKRLPAPGQSANALHPGVIKTNLDRALPRYKRLVLALAEPLVLKNLAEGAATQCYVAVHPGMRENGAYFSHCNVTTPKPKARDPELARRLWEESERIAARVMPR